MPDEAETLLVEEHWTVLAFMLAVVASHTESFIFGKPCLEVVHLIGAHFLHAQQVGTVILQHLAHSRLAVIPHVGSIDGSVQTDVECHNTYLRISQCRSRKKQEGGGKTAQMS